MSDLEQELRAELALERRAVRNRRRAFASSPLSRFAKEMQEAMDDYRRARADGVSRDDAVKGIEAVLRAVWPGKTTKFQPACRNCEDTGYQERTCWHDNRCGRPRCAERHPSFEHTYVVPCGCSAGRRFIPRQHRDDDDVVAAGKTKKSKRGFSSL